MPGGPEILAILALTVRACFGLRLPPSVPVSILDITGLELPIPDSNHESRLAEHFDFFKRCGLGTWPPFLTAQSDGSVELRLDGKTLWRIRDKSGCLIGAFSRLPKSRSWGVLSYCCVLFGNHWLLSASDRHSSLSVWVCLGVYLLRKSRNAPMIPAKPKTPPMVVAIITIAVTLKSNIVTESAVKNAVSLQDDSIQLVNMFVDKMQRIKG